MFIKNISEWISDGEPTELAEQRVIELNNTGWISSLPNHGWILIGEKFPYGVCAFYDDNKFPDKTIHEISQNEEFSDYGIPQSYACWIVNNTYIYEAFTRKLYKDSELGSSILFLSKCYVSNKGQNLVAPALMSEEADLLYKNVCDLYGEPYTMDQFHIVPMPEKLFTPFGGKFVR
jgi:hypothetical protein